MDSRAAVFTSSPQAVEVYQAGTWWRGELLGWRHDASGTCQMWVRVVVGGVEETAWIDLAALRLPEQQVSPVTAPNRIDSRVKQELPPAQAISAMRGRPLTIDAATTAALPMIRDEAPAPSVAGAAAVAPTVSVSRPAGRRRAPEDTDVQVAVAAEVAVPPGRHRADRDEGRHRAADTEIFAAIADQGDRDLVESATTAESRRAARPHVGAGWSVPQARSARPEESYGRSEVCAGRVDAEADLLTRPMRLGDLSASSRRPRVGNSVFGA
ncbi:hypothetical protein SAMN05660662_1092 [Blastococcus aurantiacus]|uniref:Uncharacterized protein n=2 Tax=Blastococcus aurantiacus TaxID=1550231 RepID=A0A1G7IB28_9ACTN|nr:hypothetical protein SAMN05660662_1092 [Blastococcus aurantiacus]